MKFAIAAIISVMMLNSLCSQTNTNISNWGLFDGEQSIAVNPSNPNIIIAAWMQLKINLKVGIAVKTSTDGGSTWGSTLVLPSINAQFTLADPSIVFSRTGTAYICYVDYGGEGADTGVVAIVKSTNNGVSWSTPLIVRGAKETNDLAIDRPWISIDNSQGPRDGYLYVTSMPPAWGPAPQALHLKYSSSSGNTWSNDIIVSNSSFPGFHSSMGIMNVSGDGALHIVYASLQVFTPYFAYARTTNLGQSFTRNYVSMLYPIADSIYQGSYSLTSDPQNPQNINMIFTGKMNGDPDIYFVRSTNGGNNWAGPPVRINNDAQNNGIGQDMSWSFQTSSLLGVCWRDRRNGTPGSLSDFDVYYSVSTNGGVSFGNNIKVTSQSSPFNTNGVKGNDFLGFTMGSDNRVHTIWADYRLGGINWEIFYNKSDVNAIQQISSEIPREFSISQNYPNPFNPETKIRFNIPSLRVNSREQTVNLLIYDLLGREVAALVNEELEPGSYEVSWDASLMPSGIYICKLSAGEFSDQVKMSLIK